MRCGVQLPGYIYFLTAKDQERPPAPVMDAVVDRWFEIHAPDRPLTVDYWHTPSYQLFLESLTEWAADIRQKFSHDIGLDDVEYLILRMAAGLKETDGESRGTPNSARFLLRSSSTS
ncbi:hypothetical protein GCM10022261_13290 [Brevibacterium daeguense]|uniref:Uncharacterized protein n=1 Tax=Brevibacterium daeguense TaxID=909936 RepID=A0ABP8EIK1_9MICO